MLRKAFLRDPLGCFWGETDLAADFLLFLVGPGGDLNGGVVFVDFRIPDTLDLGSSMLLSVGLACCLVGEGGRGCSFEGSLLLLESMLEKAIGLAVLIGACSSFTWAPCGMMSPLDVAECDE